jgi:polyribonucleotide nucleotidyltransferase
MSFETMAPGTALDAPAAAHEHVVTADVAGRAFTFKTGKLAQQAGGAVTVQVGDSMVLATATAAHHIREGIDFFPLSVDLEERMYAAGRIPGSFFRREGRPSEAAILTARLIDRPLRPLFPKGFRNEVQIICTTLSSDGQNYFDIMALVGASAALMISDVPFPEPVGAVRVGLVDGQLVFNPTTDEMATSRLDLRLAGTADAILMVECGASEVDEATMIEAIRAGHAMMRPLIDAQWQLRQLAGKPKREIPLAELPEELRQGVRNLVGGRVDDVLSHSSNKAERGVGLDALKKAVQEHYAADESVNAKDVTTAYDEFLKERVRERILSSGVRPDGRAPAQLRALSSETGMSPRAHGSGLFQRGETQVLALTTLGTLGEEQKLDNLRPETSKRFMHHYNFPAFSTGETWMQRGPKRREIGHGALAETAIRAVVPAEDVFPYAIRVVSEVLSSNGSTSMASVCASTLALMDAGVPITSPVAGIAMGLVTDGTRSVVLTDIQGMEDALGDMDFKVAGTRTGITALQMDIKLGGLSNEVLHQALGQARDARLAILDHMAQTVSEPRAELSQYAPRIFSVHIAPEFIGKLIGPGGKTIRALQEETGAKIDIQDDGTVYIATTDGEAAEKARQRVLAITEVPEAGKVYEGKVTRTTDFGCFVEILPGVEGMVHISQLAAERINQVTDVVENGDEILVMVTDVVDGKIRLSRLAVLEGWTLEEARASDKGIGGRSGPRPGGDRPGGDRRGGGGGDRRGGGR